MRRAVDRVVPVTRVPLSARTCALRAKLVQELEKKYEQSSNESQAPRGRILAETPGEPTRALDERQDHDSGVGLGGGNVTKNHEIVPRAVKKVG